MRVLVLLALAACSGGRDVESRTETLATTPSTPTTPQPPTQAPPQPPAPAQQPVVLVTDPAVLAKLSASYDDVVAPDGRSLIARTTAADVAAAGKGDPEAGVGIAGNSHRLFDVGWLDKGYFELIGLAYRIDRIPVTEDTCGDIRLVYRLAYRAKSSGVAVSSRLPMTVTVVFDGPPRTPTADDAIGCRAAAAQWRFDAALTAEARGTELAKRLADTFDKDRVRQVLTNTQVVRWPSAARPDLAGHAEYALRAYRREASPSGATFMRYVVAPADHTPAVAKLKRGPLRDKLLAWLGDPQTLAAIDRGWVQLPAEFTATSALSVSPRGFSRRANRLWRQIFAPKDLAALPLSTFSTISTPSALLRRLDDQTCNGCHQSQTIAGFHMLGEDGPDVAPGNAMAVAISPPLVAEVKRREALLDALATGRSADALLARPSMERTGNLGQRGARCGLGDAGFASWTCNAGLTCQPTDAPKDDADVGECLPPADQRGYGDPCELGPLTANANPRRDSGPRANPGACVNAACNTNRVGFPGGMCSGDCDAGVPGSTCGVIAVLTPFNNCLARDRPFPECIAEHVRPAGLRACDLATPCRDDYVCARTPKTAGGRPGDPKTEGGCMPPYFLFQLRVDGHPSSKRQP